MRKLSCEQLLMRWGYLSASGQLSQVRYSSARYGQQMSTKPSGSSILVSKYVIVDIHARKLGILPHLKAYYIEGWKHSPRKGFHFKPDGRRKGTAHKARKILAEYMGIKETPDNTEEEKQR